MPLQNAMFFLRAQKQKPPLSSACALINCDSWCPVCSAGRAARTRNQEKPSDLRSDASRRRGRSNKNKAVLATCTRNLNVLSCLGPGTSVYVCLCVCVTFFFSSFHFGQRCFRVTRLFIWMSQQQRSLCSQYIFLPHIHYSLLCPFRLSRLTESTFWQHEFPPR